MTSDNVFLKQNVLAEPLINHWYAWPYLVPPATGSMFLANSHIRIMESFVASPQVHVAAVKNPAMIGGPFMNYDASRIPEVKALLEGTVKRQSHLIELAGAIKALDEMLNNEADGHSLESIYKKAPEPLKGYVELVYDLNNHASIRFIEGLLYKSRYYDETSQSVELSFIDRDDRSFVFSTPRLKQEGRLRLNVPFKSASLDELFKMKDAAQPLDHIKERLEIAPADEQLFTSLFTSDAPAIGSPYTGEGVRVRYYGHACILIESRETSVLIDPLISYKYGSQDNRFTYADLPPVIDHVLITHNHQDHCLFETLLQLRHRIKSIVVPRSGGGSLSDPSLKLILNNIGFKNVMEIDEMESIEIEGGSITGVPFLGEHADLNIRTKTAHLITMKGKSMLCAADSNNIEPMLYKHVHDIVGDLDIVFLGMECVGGPLSWLYGPLLTRPLARRMDQSRRFDGSDCEKALLLIDQLKPKQSYVYAMGHEPWLAYLTSINYTEESRQIVESNKFVEGCKSRNLVSERLYCSKEMFL